MQLHPDHIEPIAKNAFAIYCEATSQNDLSWGSASPEAREEWKHAVPIYAQQLFNDSGTDLRGACCKRAVKEWGDRAAEYHADNVVSKVKTWR